MKVIKDYEYGEREIPVGKANTKIFDKIKEELDDYDSRRAR